VNLDSQAGVFITAGALALAALLLEAFITLKYRNRAAKCEDEVCTTREADGQRQLTERELLLALLQKLDHHPAVQGLADGAVSSTTGSLTTGASYAAMHTRMSPRVEAKRTNG